MDKTPVERAAGLYQTALEQRRGKECSEQQFYEARNQARDDVRNVLVMEGMVEPKASDMARAGELLWDAMRRGRA